MPTGVIIWHKGSLVGALIDTGVAYAMELLGMAGIFASSTEINFKGFADQWFFEPRRR